MKINNTNIDYKIGDMVECVNEHDKMRYIGKNNNYGMLLLRNIKKDGSLGEIVRGYIGRKHLEGKRGRIIDIVGEKLIVGFLPNEYDYTEPHPYFFSYPYEEQVGRRVKHLYGYYEYGVECSSSKVELVSDDLEIRKLEEEINIKEKEIEELKQQIETIKKEVV